MNFNIGAGTNRGAPLGVTVGSTTGTAFTPSATANTKGTIIELSSALPFDVYGFNVLFWNSQAGAAGQTNWGFNFYLGAGGSEVEVHPDIVLGGIGIGAASAPQMINIPLFLPRGQRLSAALQCNQVTQPQVAMVLRLNSEGFLSSPVYSKATAYGYDATNTRGTASNSGGTANTLGAIVQLDAAIASPIKALTLNVTGDTAQTTGTASKALIDIMIGAAAAEQMIFQQVFAAYQSSQMYPCLHYLGNCDIAKGSRLSVRHQANNTGTNPSTARTLRMHAIGYS